MSSGLDSFGGRTKPWPGPLIIKPPLRWSVDSWVVPSLFNKDVFPNKSGLPGGKSPFILWKIVWAMIFFISFEFTLIANSYFVPLPEFDPLGNASKPPPYIHDA